MSPDEYTEEVSTTLSKDEKRAKRWAETKMDFKWATALLFVLILALSGYLWGGWQRPVDHEEDLAAMTELLLSPDGLVAPFEILGVLLLVALIAGVAMASRDPVRRPDDESWRERDAASQQVEYDTEREA